MNVAVEEQLSMIDDGGQPLAPEAAAYDAGGNGFGSEIADWRPQPMSVDAALLPELSTANARSDDLSRNHGVAAGATQLHVDNIVGHLFKPSVKINWRRVGITEDEARDLAKKIEAAFHEYAEDEVHCYIDAERKRTFTMLIREGIATHTRLGEILSSAEWIDHKGSPFKTSIKVVSPHRLSNPAMHMDNEKIRGGVESDKYGAALYYHIREAINTPFGGLNPTTKWKRVARENRWGRQQIMHVFEPTDDGQTRGANSFMSVISRLKMLDKFQATQLQTAIINAMYAAVIETGLDSEKAFEIVGGDKGTQNVMAKWMEQSADYHDAQNLKLNGSKIAHLMPGEEFKLLTPGNTGSGFAEFESSILRNVAAGLNVSYEQLARDYSKTNYSSARASMMESWRYFMGRRKTIANRYATMIYSLWLEEAIDRGIIKLPEGAVSFYDAKSAWCNVKWIGAGRLQIDGLKEVKEAILRIESGLSTYEKEIALMGEDYQEVFEQQVREMKERKDAGLPTASWVAAQELAPDSAPEETEQTKK
jgi:lambda family phage portal protein